VNIAYCIIETSFKDVWLHVNVYKTETERRAYFLRYFCLLHRRTKPDLQKYVSIILEIFFGGLLGPLSDSDKRKK